MAIGAPLRSIAAFIAEGIGDGLTDTELERILLGQSIRPGVPYITEGAEVVAKITGSSVEDELAARRRLATA